MGPSIGRERDLSLALVFRRAPTDASMPPRMLSPNELLDQLERVARPARRDSFAEHRSRRSLLRQHDEHGRVEQAFWNHVTAPRGELDSAEKRALSKASGAVGGFLAPSDLADQVLQVLRASDPIAGRATEFLTDTGWTLNLPVASTHGVSVWTAEAAAYPASSDEGFSQVALGANKATTTIITSEELLQDASFPLDTYLAAEFGRRLAALEGTAYIAGTGSGQPQGIVANITSITAASGNSTSFDWPSIVAVVHALPPAYRPGAVFVMNDATAKAIRLLKDSSNLPIWTGNLRRLRLGGHAGARGEREVADVPERRPRLCDPPRQLARCTEAGRAVLIVCR
jgi:HK97 family phage major capsid protein